MRLYSLLFLVLALTGCTRIAVLKEIHPVFPAVSQPVAGLQQPLRSLEHAGACAEKTPLVAGEHYLSALQELTQQLDRSPRDETARKAYNFALDRVFSLVRAESYDPWSAPLRIGRYTLTWSRAPRTGWQAGTYDFLPTDQVRVGGEYLTDVVKRDGLGSTLVAIGRTPKSDFRSTFSQERTYYGITAVADFSGSACRIAFHDPQDEDTVRLGRHTYPLAADYTTPLAVLLTRERPEKLGLVRLLDPDKYAKTARISRLRPYDPKRIPLLLVHGLLDTPATWVPMVNALNSDPFIRKNYQIWVFSYPSGYPYPYAASLLREELAGVKLAFPGHKPVVYVGHSMGGMIGRLMVTTSERKIWEAYFHAPPDEVRMSDREKQLMRNMLIFETSPDISRAVFICSPHRGAEMAGGWVGRIGRKLVRVPQMMISLGEALTKVLTLSEGGLAYENLPTSIDTLTPTNLFVKTVDSLPLSPRIPVHSIMGDRGKPEAREHPEGGSDSFVPYTSSHLDGAVSELIIPSDHSGHQHPEGIAEVRRILHLHLGDRISRHPKTVDVISSRLPVPAGPAD